MATFTVRPEGIIRQPALTMPGNATGAEAACTSLTASQIRTLLGLGTTSDVTFDIVRATTSVQAPLVNNAAAALTLGNSTYGVTVPGAAVVSGDISMQKATQGYIYAYNPSGTNYGRFYTSNANETHVEAQTYLILRGGSTGIVEVSKSGVTAKVRVYDSGATKYTDTYHDSTNGILSTSSGNLRFELSSAGGYYDFPGVVATGNTVRIWNNTNTAALQLRHTGNGQIESSAGKLTLIASAAGKWIELQPNSGLVDHYTAGTNSVYRAWNAQGNGYVEITHDITNGIVSTVNTANLNLVPAGGTVAVTGGITASGVVSHGAYTVATLPAAGSNAGKMAQVTDSNVAASGNYGATVAAGGANRVKVFSDGTNWVIA